MPMFWSSGSCDSLWYFHTLDTIFPLTRVISVKLKLLKHRFVNGLRICLLPTERNSILNFAILICVVHFTIIPNTWDDLLVYVIAVSVMKDKSLDPCVLPKWRFVSSLKLLYLLMSKLFPKITVTNSIQFNSIQFNSTQFCSIQFIYKITHYNNIIKSTINTQTTNLSAH